MTHYQRNLASPHSGFTLVELMVVVVIMGVIASMAIPSFARTFAQQRAQQGATDIITAVNQARTQAALSNKPATLTISNNNLQYQVSFTATNNGSLQTSSYTLDSQNLVTVPAGASNSITVYPNGQLSSSLYYRVCPSNGLTNGYTVWINSFGISRFASGPTANVGSSDGTITSVTNASC